MLYILVSCYTIITTSCVTRREVRKSLAWTRETMVISNILSCIHYQYVDTAAVANMPKQSLFQLVLKRADAHLEVYISVEMYITV